MTGATNMNGMVTLFRTAALITLSLVFSAWAHAAEISGGQASFPLASVHFEQNATDGDSEVVFQVKGGKDGLAELTVKSPRGQTVVAFRAPDATTLGIRQFRFESPEPTDIGSLKVAYPEGAYDFAGTTFSGAKFVGRSRLSHQLPAITTVVSPKPDAKNVPAARLKISWQAVSGIASYVIGIKQADSNVSVTATVPPSATSFDVPDGLLSRGQKYQLSIGTVARNGNTSFVETTFYTGK